MKRIIFTILILLAAIVVVIPSVILLSAGINDPDIGIVGEAVPNPQTDDGILFYSGNNWIQQNDQGLYELYVEGSGLQCGLERGSLSQELIHKQEALFVERIQELVPSKIYLYFLKELVSWFNRDLPDYIPEEYRRELFGISRFASDEYDFIGEKYERVVNYHAAHDIGHALQNYNLVGCTSFARWDSTGTSMLIGRNFDFSMGERFAENKIVCFYHPANGIDFMMISWSDFIGCVSGMNAEGLTVTINAGENTIPTDVGTPISLIAREILQYAANIEEAYHIALNRKSFVSEAILIGSASDGKTAIIEKTPDTTLLVLPSGNGITCSNHFQSAVLESNQNYDVEPSTRYRFERVEHLLAQTDSTTPASFAKILRDQKGKDGRNIGMGNEKSINQLVAHHSIIFQPHERKFWISLPPFQLGAYLCYDLDEIFTKKAGLRQSTVNYLPEETIPADSFLLSSDFKRFRKWNLLKDSINKAIDENQNLESLTIETFVRMNQRSFTSYETAGRYFSSQSIPERAKLYFNKALEMEAPNPWDAEQVKQHLEDLAENE